MIFVNTQIKTLETGVFIKNINFVVIAITTLCINFNHYFLSVEPAVNLDSSRSFHSLKFKAPAIFAKRSVKVIR